MNSQAEICWTRPGRLSAARLKEPSSKKLRRQSRRRRISSFNSITPISRRPRESLRARLARGPLSVREAVSILKDVARALVYAHGHGIILARRECIRTEYRDGRYACVQWYDCKPGSTVC